MVALFMGQWIYEHSPVFLIKALISGCAHEGGISCIRVYVWYQTNRSSKQQNLSKLPAV